jgi:hypothetical protein
MDKPTFHVEDANGASAAEAERHLAETTAAQYASGVPFPGPSLGAFTDRGVEALGLRLRPMTIADLFALQALDSPMLRLSAVVARTRGQSEAEISAAIDAEVELSGPEILAHLWVFSRPADAPEIFGADAAHIRRAARAAFATRFSPAALETLFRAVFAVYLQGHSTALRYQARAEGEDSELFTTPLPGPMTTASAAACTSSAP